MYQAGIIVDETGHVRGYAELVRALLGGYFNVAPWSSQRLVTVAAASSDSSEIDEAAEAKISTVSEAAWQQEINDAAAFIASMGY